MFKCTVNIPVALSTENNATGVDLETGASAERKQDRKGNKFKPAAPKVDSLFLASGPATNYARSFHPFLVPKPFPFASRSSP